MKLYRFGHSLILEALSRSSLEDFVKNAVTKITLFYLSSASVEQAATKVTIEEFKNALIEVSSRDIFSELKRYELRMKNYGIDLRRLSKEQFISAVKEAKQSLYKEFSMLYKALSSQRKSVRDEIENPEQYSAPDSELLAMRFNGRSGRALYDTAIEMIKDEIIEEFIKDPDDIYRTEKGGPEQWFRLYAYKNGLNARRQKGLIDNMDKDEILDRVRHDKFWKQCGLEPDEVSLFVNYYSFKKAKIRLSEILKAYASYRD